MSAMMSAVVRVEFGGNAVPVPSCSSMSSAPLADTVLDV